MPVQSRWIVIHMEGRKLWPGYAITKLEPFQKLLRAQRRAEGLAGGDDPEHDFVTIWDSVLEKTVWGPQ